MTVTALSGKSAATGRPHFFYGGLYTCRTACAWCGWPKEHAWHLTSSAGQGEQ